MDDIWPPRRIFGEPHHGACKAGKAVRIIVPLASRGIRIRTTGPIEKNGRVYQPQVESWGERQTQDGTLARLTR